MKDKNLVSKKKETYPIKADLKKYLINYERYIQLPVTYDSLLRSNGSFPLLDKFGKDTLWETQLYAQSEYDELNKGLTKVYSMLKTDGNTKVLEHLYVERIDYCTFGNSNPFRVRIINKFNDNYDYFYIKKADASRVYGLELEHILSPNIIHFYTDGDTLVEEHIVGIPGDQFLEGHFKKGTVNKVRLAKEFVKFNERCFARLLGDMRSYNYVLDITPDFDDEQYRIRAIDFDQQSYEGKKTIYLPQFFKENKELVNLTLTLLSPETIKQYQYEERSLILRRVKAERYRLKEIIDVMRSDSITKPEKFEQLKKELYNHYKDKEILNCECMGDLLRINLKILLVS